MFYKVFVISILKQTTLRIQGNVPRLRKKRMHCGEEIDGGA